MGLGVVELSPFGSRTCAYPPNGRTVYELSICHPSGQPAALRRLRLATAGYRWMMVTASPTGMAVRSAVGPENLAGLVPLQRDSARPKALGGFTFNDVHAMVPPSDQSSERYSAEPCAIPLDNASR